MRSVLVTALATAALVLGGMYWLTNRTIEDVGYCRVEVGETVTEIDVEQATWAALMAKIGHQRDLPPRATTIAIATAYQESKMRNIDYGDRDSVGLFQQRPSQGWGSVEQIMDPTYSINRFYDALSRVPGYENMEITVAAQTVQRSGYPDAYAQHEANARALASALRGHSPASFACAIEPTTGSAKKAVADITSTWGDLPTETDGDNTIVWINKPKRDAAARGWAVAHTLVANAGALGVTEVRHDGYRWRAKDRSPQWKPDSTAPAHQVVFKTR